MAAKITSVAPDGTVLFIVGMRINKLWAIHKWLPVTVAMPKMLIEQIKKPELGMLGTPRTFVSGRIVQVQQYWKNYEALENYSKDPGANHLKAWRSFNKAARNNSAVGIFHETYIIQKGNHENIYVNLPKPILLGSAVGVQEVASNTATSRQRMK